ncbi:hypothetical protein C8R44DRAFT_896458 [Mycena epipterygia]|nr:hypothetical protein C8R44DRAFT_896458 [Mycena epipterygia]
MRGRRKIIVHKSDLRCLPASSSLDLHLVPSQSVASKSSTPRIFVCARPKREHAFLCVPLINIKFNYNGAEPGFIFTHPCVVVVDLDFCISSGNITISASLFHFFPFDLLPSMRNISAYTHFDIVTSPIYLYFFPTPSKPTLLPLLMPSYVDASPPQLRAEPVRDLPVYVSAPASCLQVSLPSWILLMIP